MNTTYVPTFVSFEKARPIWAAGREEEMNLWLSFRTVLPKSQKALLRLTGSSAYTVKVGGSFVAFGPARCAHGFYRVDELDLSSYASADSVLTVTVAGYAVNSFYLLDQPSFLCAELICDGAVVAATGDAGFLCREVAEHEEKAHRYSYQRTFCEVYNLTPAYEAWDTALALPDGAFPLLTPAPTADKTFIARGCSYNTYDRVPADAVISTETFAVNDHSDELRYSRWINVTEPTLKHYPKEEVTTDCHLMARNLDLTSVAECDEKPRPVSLTPNRSFTLRMKHETTGALAFDVVCEEDAELIITFDEYLSENHYINYRRLGSSCPVWRLTKGTYHLSTFEPYSMTVLRFFALRGRFTVSNVHLIAFCADKVARRYKGDDPALAKIFDAAVETYRQNTFTIYMDCPSRERAGWLCDSFFTSRVEKTLTGKSEIERNFLENFFLPDSFAALPHGMFPMCYPGDQKNGSFIPNWAMWLVLELEEYLARTGDRAFVDAAKPRIDALLAYFTRFENEDGLLEKLERWIFVEWSKCNELGMDVNYPTNMLYARMLRAYASLYGDKDAAAKADRIFAVIREQSMTESGFFCDNAVRDEAGVLRLSGVLTETCQYYAFFCGAATPESHPLLWERMVRDFGPQRINPGEWPNLREDAAWRNVYPSNAFIGTYLRMELLFRYGEHQKLLENIRGYNLKMAELTGTLWENDSPSASCNHGFASHITYWLDGIGMVE